MSACEQLAIQMDVLEEYLKIEKLDPTQVPDAAIKHKEESFAKMTNEFSSVENSGKQFIKDANDVSMHAKCGRFSSNVACYLTVNYDGRQGCGVFVFVGLRLQLQS